MSKAIEMQAILTSFSSKVDRSAGLRISTPELSTDEFEAIRAMQGSNVLLIMAPDNSGGEVISVEEKIEGKSPSTRLRSVLFVYWKEKKKETFPDFEVFYRSMMEKYIDGVKAKLP